MLNFVLQLNVKFVIMTKLINYNKTIIVFWFRSIFRPRSIYSHQVHKNMYWPHQKTIIVYCILRNMAYPFSHKNLHKSNVRCFSMTALWRQLSPLECWPRTQIHPWSLYILYHVAFDDVHSKCVVKLKEKNRNG